MKKITLLFTIFIMFAPCLTAQSAKLFWNSNTEPNMESYNMFRSTDSGNTYFQINHEPIIHTGAGTETFTDFNVEVGSTYFYYCKAVNDLGNISEKSNVVFITITEPPVPEIPAAPAGLSVTVE